MGKQRHSATLCEISFKRWEIYPLLLYGVKLCSLFLNKHRIARFVQDIRDLKQEDMVQWSISSHFVNTLTCIGHIIKLDDVMNGTDRRQVAYISPHEDPRFFICVIVSRFCVAYQTCDDYPKQGTYCGICDRLFKSPFCSGFLFSLVNYRFTFSFLKDLCLFLEI